MPEIAIACGELDRAKADRARQDAEVCAIVASIDAAVARQQYADADRLIADGRKRYPFFNGWADLLKRVADARCGAPDTAAAPPPQRR